MDDMVLEERVCPYSKNVRNRMSRNLGHLARVKRMIDEGEDYTRVMMQLSAVRASLASTTNELMMDQMNQALQEAQETNDTERLETVYYSVKKYFSK